MHEIGIHLEGGINLSEKKNVDGDIEKVYMTFGKYSGKPVASVPPYYRKWLIDNKYQPKYFQSLCHNCNQSKGHSRDNTCAHVRKLSGDEK